MFFDSNRNGVWNTDEPSVWLTTNADGSLPAAPLQIPTVLAGEYKVHADIPVRPPTEASVFVTVIAPSLVLNPSTGPAGTLMTVNGTNFVAGDAGRIFFDSNGNYAYDAGERSQVVIMNSDGTFSMVLSVPP